MIFQNIYINQMGGGLVWSRIARARTWTLAFTKARFFWLLTLPPNGSSLSLSGCFFYFLFLWFDIFLSFNYIWYFFYFFGFASFGDVFLWISGFTDSNYSQLTDLYNKYKHKGHFFFPSVIVSSSSICLLVSFTVSYFKCFILF